MGIIPENSQFIDKEIERKREKEKRQKEREIHIYRHNPQYVDLFYVNYTRNFAIYR